MLGQGCPAGLPKTPFFRFIWKKGVFAPLYNLFFLSACAAVCTVYGLSSLFSYASEQPGILNSSAAESSADDLSWLRLNLSWTSDKPQKWEGELRLENGAFTGLVPLGSEPGASVTFYPSEDRQTLFISSPEPTAYCGVQVTVAAAPSSRASLSFRNVGGTPFSKTFSFSEAQQGSIRVPLDDAGHDLLIERAAGDRIPVSVRHLDRDGQPMGGTIPSMVFRQGETLLVRVPVSRLPAGSPAKQLSVTLSPSGGGSPVWSETESLSTQAPDAVIEIPVPIRNIDGAFDLLLELTEPENTKSKFFLPPNPFASSGKESPLPIRRLIQGIALSPARPSTYRTDSSEPVDMRDTLLDTIDPTNPAWWKIFARRSGVKEESSAIRQHSEDMLKFNFLEMWQWGELQASVKSLNLTSGWGRWDTLWQRPLSSGHLTPLESADPRDASFVKLASSGNPADPSWESYTVPIKEPGKPHVLEIEYLPDYPQKLGVTILEPSVSGGLFPRSLDTGLIVGEDPLSDQDLHRVLRYTLLFWPKTVAPTILLTNRDSQNPAVYGRIRIYRAKEDFNAMVAPSDKPRRRMTAVMSRPTFCDQFFAENVSSTAGVVGARDWRTFQQGAERLTDYLKINGWDSLLLSVMADGSALYPSPILRPNPQFDSGVFLTEGNDPVRKDASDYLLRHFERENLALIPLFTFNAPLPVLESEIRAARGRAASSPDQTDSADPDAYYLVGTKGESISKEGKPGYNILHPAVQREVLRCLDEFAARYAAFPALRDVALDLSSDTFVRLPDNIYNGLDDQTILRFAQETQLEKRCPESLRPQLRDFISARDEQRYLRRASMIRDYLTEDWIKWRALTVSRFYRLAANVVGKHIPQTRLLLLTVRSEPESVLPAAVSSEVSSALAEAQALRRRGLDLGYLSQAENVSWIRSLPTGAGWRAAGLSADASDPYAGLSVGEAGALFYRDSRPLNIPSFDRASPYHPTVTQIDGVFSYSDYQNLERWAKQLALSDIRSLMDGGPMLPMGGEEAQERWIAAFRALPDEPFETYLPGAETEDRPSPESGAALTVLPNASGPVVFRYRQEEDGFWGYLVSTAPFHCGVTLSLGCLPRAETTVYAGGRELSRPEQNSSGIRWNCSLGPYDLVSFHVGDPNVSIKQVDTMLPVDICGEGGRLEENAKMLISRLRLAADGIETQIRNAGFEEELPEPEFGGGNSGSESKAGGPIFNLEIPAFNDLVHNPFTGGKTAESGAAVPVSEPGLPPGWHRFGSPEFTAELDSRCRTEGESSLKLASRESAGGIIGEAFPLPKTGRLYVDARFGLPADLSGDLPLFVSLTGKQGGEPWQKRIPVGPELLRRAREMKQSGAGGEDGVIWVRHSLLFDALPTEDTENFTVRFDLLPSGTVWIDDLHLYKLAFDRTEQESIAALIDQLEDALRNGNTASLLRHINTSAAAALAAQLPSDAPEMTRLAMREPDITAAAEKQTSGAEPAETESDSAGAVPAAEEKNFLKRILPW